MSNENGSCAWLAFFSVFFSARVGPVSWTKNKNYKMTGHADSQIARWDFTLSHDCMVAAEGDVQELICLLQAMAKHWVFQLEEGESGYLHYQGRVSLKKKSRHVTFLPRFAAHWSPTGNATRGFDYVQKEDTRVDGPWSDLDDNFVPTHIEEIKSLLPWQQTILDSIGKPSELRIVNVVVDAVGGIGKSMLREYAHYKHKAVVVPAENDAKALVAAVCNILSGRKDRNPSMMIVDLPRAVCKERMDELFAGIERLKDGRAVDLRHRYRDWSFNPCAIWVFTNTVPRAEMLSADRWRVWAVENKTLVDFVTKAPKSMSPKSSPATAVDESEPVLRKVVRFIDPDDV